MADEQKNRRENGKNGERSGIKHERYDEKIEGLSMIHKIMAKCDPGIERGVN